MGADHEQSVEAAGRVTETPFQRKLREKREAVAAEKVDTSQFDDLVPDEDSGYNRSEEDLTIDRLIDEIDIVKAYDRWIGKPRPRQREAKREGYMISCPMPGHTDSNPSAWINKDKQTWYCAGCAVGGDKLDLAAIYFGMGDYKTGARFGELRRKIAENLGYKIIEVSSSKTTVVPVAPQATVEAQADSSSSLEQEGTSTVVKLPEVSSLEDALPTLDWHPLIEPDTFLDEYMKATTQDDMPEEYHFWHGVLCLGMAIGRDVVLDDLVPVLGNLMICIIGRTGSGKSRATRHATELIAEALPYDITDPMDRGAKKIYVPGSAEVLIHQFSRPIHDPSNPKLVLGYASVRGLVEFSELSSLLGRTGRMGSVLKPTLMQFFDGDKRITSTSMTSGAQVAENAFASVVTSVQPKALQSLVGHEDASSGFLNRWIFVNGTYKKRVAVGGARIDLSKAKTALQRIHQWAEDPRLIKWSDEAQRAFEILFQGVIEPITTVDDTGLFGRIDLLAKKMCLLLTANEMQEYVTAKTVVRVESILKYLLEIFNVQAESLGDDYKRCQDAIIDFLRKQASKFPNGIPRYVIVNKVSRKKFSLKIILDSLDLLDRAELIKSYVPPTKSRTGRPPGVHYMLLEN